MCNPNRSDLALSFWTVSVEYLMLVENVASEIVTHGNPWFMMKDSKCGEFTTKEYDDATCWSDHTLIIPLLFNLYHGIELLMKGFLFAAADQNVEPIHTIDKLCHQFRGVYPKETELIDFFTKFTDKQRLPALLLGFLNDNSLTPNDLYQAVRYPSDRSSQTLRKYMGLKCQGKDGIPFFRELVEDIKAIRVAAVRLGRSLEPRAGNGQQHESMLSAGTAEA